MKPFVIKCNPDESGDITFPYQNLEKLIDLVYKAGLTDGNKVTVVLCKDCTNYDSHGHRCKHWNHGVTVAEWCSSGERREDVRKPDSDDF